jgi:hypothetical protein
MKKLFVLFLLFACARSAFAQTLEARFLEVEGAVETKAAASPGWRKAAPGDRIEKDTIISTGFKSRAVISLGSSRLDLRPLTMLTLEELVSREGGEAASLYLRTGRIRAQVNPPTGQDIDFTVGSPTVTASVRGTSFEFDGRRLWVESGLVLLTGTEGQKVYVAKAQKSYVDKNNQNRLMPPFEAEAALLRPIIPELNNTGGGGTLFPEMGVAAPGSDNRFRIYLNWP